MNGDSLAILGRKTKKAEKLSENRAI